ncbi:hypothetical protein PENTCL1PPCAC_21126, partial [Pristionchus entomophagus]
YTSIQCDKTNGWTKDGTANTKIPNSPADSLLQVYCEEYCISSTTTGMRVINETDLSQTGPVRKIRCDNKFRGLFYDQNELKGVDSEVKCSIEKGWEPTGRPATLDYVNSKQVLCKPACKMANDSSENVIQTLEDDGFRKLFKCNVTAIGDEIGISVNDRYSYPQLKCKLAMGWT